MAPAGAAEQDAPPTDCREAKSGRIVFLFHGEPLVRGGGWWLRRVQRSKMLRLRMVWGSKLDASRSSRTTNSVV